MLTTSPPAQQHTDAGSLRAILAALFLSLLLAAMDQTIVSTALPTIVAELGGLEHLSWVVTAYLLTSTVVLPLYGKLGDIHGRKIVLQVAIVIFLIGSALCGLARSMPELIIFRAIQGIGGGGLIVTTMALIGDLIPPRERGRYQGLFGAAFSFATIVGPLLGGFFVDNLSWRWIFYINLPLGAAALAVIAAVLPATRARRAHAIDYPGALFLAVALSAVILFTSLGGSTYPWTSPFILTLIGTGAAAFIAFIAVERRAREPILPLELFRNRTFAIATGVGLIVGLSLFGSVTYLPVYLQMVKGESPTASGWQLMPMMLAMLTTSIVSGRLITRWGRYKLFPVTGTSLMVVGLLLLSQLSAERSVWLTSLDALILGLGMGMVMQVLVLAVQNSVDFAHLGTATSGTTLARAVGGALGVALFGAIFLNGLHSHLAAVLSPGIQMPSASNPQSLQALPPELRAAYVSAVVAALRPVFTVAAAIAAIGFTLTLFLREVPLRGVAPSATIFAMPRDATSLEELERIVGRLMARENRWRVYADLAARAQLDLPPTELWMLARLGEREPQRADALSKELGIPWHDLQRPLNALCDRGLAEKDAGGELRLTPGGREMRERLLAARRQGLEDMLTRWEPEKHPDVLALLDRMRDTLVQDLPVPRKQAKAA